MKILEVEQVSHLYGVGTPFRTEALKNVSVGFERGLITGVIGHTGSGKSTLVQMLNGLIRPAEGRVLLDGKDIWEKPKEIRSVRFRVGLVMQYPEYQLFDETVEKDIGYALRNQGLGQDEIRERVREVISFVGLTPDLLEKSPFDLSGGQKRRAAIAGILAMRPDVLVLDEPAAGLDPRGRREILGGLTRYRDKTGTTVILVSHSMEDMATYCDRVVVMNHGEVYAEGTTDEIFARAGELDSIGLDVPQIAHVALSLKERGIPLTGTLYTVDGVKNALLPLLKGRKTP
ncbi:MAG: energy-coupling factor transporter ATPase [Clostridia bacterium]|nr:energy-coupling factor transporter ATPase [Clostridia bacterium]MDY6184809.1 energy-coupling factor transporter ATPase [Eubacteriales bacterium]